MSNLSSFGSDLYDGAASLGKMESYVHLVIGGILSIILIIIGIHLLFVNQNNLVNSTAIVGSAQCVPNVGQNGTTYSCNLQVHYVVNGKPYTNQISSDSATSYVAGDSVAITYNSSNPSNVTTQQIKDSTWGYILLGIGIVIGLCVYYNYYMTTHSKVYAAAEGAEESIGLVKDVFRAF